MRECSLLFFCTPQRAEGNQEVASLEFLEGKELPGVEALTEK